MDFLLQYSSSDKSEFIWTVGQHFLLLYELLENVVCALLFVLQLVPPVGMLNNPMNAVTTKFVRTSTNKVKCPVFVIRVRSRLTSCHLPLYVLAATSKLRDGKIMNTVINVFLWKERESIFQHVDVSTLTCFLFVSSGLLKVDVWSPEPRVESSRCGMDSPSTLRPFYR